MDEIRSESQEPETFKPQIDPQLKRRLKALQERLDGPAGDSLLATNDGEPTAYVKRLVERITRVERAIKAQEQVQLHAYLHARGELPLPQGTALEGSVRTVSVVSRKGVAHKHYEIVHKATPSTSVPIVNPDRIMRRKLFPGISGRQWVRLRKALKREMRADVQAQMKEAAKSA